ncbi:MAG TPA: DUF1697 domain-containing protein [Ktedonobacteraceae bacterium]|nr:DUF1697 domain-containing protein [Ktedonobacteraceae bacterium]
MTACVSLFRGINVGGRQVPMSDLKELHEALGLKDVVTYIQSGNVVFTSDSADTTQLSKRIEDGFAQKFGFRVSAIVRTAAEIEEVIMNNPFQKQVLQAPKWVLVLFLATRPAITALEELRKAYTGPEEFYLVGQDLYIYYPNGVGRSKLTNTLIEKKLKTSGTGRNWNTILQLRKMMQR